MVAITELLEREIARLKTLPNDEQDAIALFPPTATKPEPVALRLNPLPAVGESHPVGFALLRANMPPTPSATNSPRYPTSATIAESDFDNCRTIGRIVLL